MAGTLPHFPFPSSQRPGLHTYGQTVWRYLVHLYLVPGTSISGTWCIYIWYLVHLYLVSGTSISGILYLVHLLHLWSPLHCFLHSVFEGGKQSRFEGCDEQVQAAHLCRQPGRVPWVRSLRACPHAGGSRGQRGQGDEEPCWENPLGGERALSGGLACKPGGEWGLPLGQGRVVLEKHPDWCSCRGCQPWMEECAEDLEKHWRILNSNWRPSWGAAPPSGLPIFSHSWEKRRPLRDPLVLVWHRSQSDGSSDSKFCQCLVRPPTDLKFGGLGNMSSQNQIWISSAWCESAGSPDDILHSKVDQSLDCNSK